MTLLNRRRLIGVALAACADPALAAPAGERLATAAKAQIGVTRGYDPEYRRLAYPGGDPPRATGVCADVIVRAGRDALGLDLQSLVHEDMKAAFAAYPSRRVWGLARPDASIDHRRVLNLEVYWRRAGCQQWWAQGRRPGYEFGGPPAVGDSLTWLLWDKLPHVALVSRAGQVPMIVHNVGRGAEEIPLALMAPHRPRGRFRWPRA